MSQLAAQPTLKSTIDHAYEKSLADWQRKARDYLQVLRDVEDDLAHDHPRVQQAKCRLAEALNGGCIHCEDRAVNDDALAAVAGAYERIIFSGSR